MIIRKGEIPDAVWDYVDGQLDVKASFGTAERFVLSLPIDDPISIYLVLVHDASDVDTSHKAKIMIVFLSRNQEHPEQMMIRTLYVHEYERRRRHDRPSANRFILSHPTLSDDEWKRQLKADTAAYLACDSLYEAALYIDKLKTSHK